jgi:peroxiredoxin
MNTKYNAVILAFAVGVVVGTQLIKIIPHRSTDKAVVTTLNDDSMVGKRITDFSLPDLNGVKHDIHEWDGRVIVLNFWATWCPPCRKETPMFVELQDKLRKKGLQFVGVAIDDHDKVKEFKDTFSINYPVLVGVDNAIEVAKVYGNRFGALPYTVIIDRKGKIVFVQRGKLERDVLEKNLKTLNL